MKTKSMTIKDNNLYIGKFKATDLANIYKTPLYVFDEAGLREKLDIFKKYFKSDIFECEVVYASKAFLAPYLCDILGEYDFGIDAVSCGDMFLVDRSHFNKNRIILHGNNKSDEELKMAIDLGVEYIVIDNLEELTRLLKIAKNTKKEIHTLIRVNPGIEAHTHKYIVTSALNSKFGESIYDLDRLKKMMNLYKTNDKIIFDGFHAHIGSQINESTAFIEEGKKMYEFIMEFEKETLEKVKVLDLGGGFGIKYLDSDKEINLKEMLTDTVKNLEALFGTSSNLKKIMIEPGRSIIGDNGVTLYKSNGSKVTFGKKRYVFVDGGMGDNIRPALYQAKYTVDIANHMENDKKYLCDVVGKCCESGDIIATDIELGEVSEGDTLVVYATGAYCYSMSMNYNGLTRGACIFVNNDKVSVAIRREEVFDLVNTCVFKEEKMKFFDTHSDMLFDLYNRYEQGEKNRFTSFHVPQLKNSLVRGAIWTMYSSYDFDLINACKIALNELDLSDFKEFNVILGIEGCRNLKKWEDIDILYKMGFRHAMLTWNEENIYATGAKSNPEMGLKEDGKKLLSRMMELGMIVDLAHLNHKSFFEVLDYCKGYDKLIYSHGCCRSLCDHVRNMTDEMMIELKKANGLFGLTLANNFVSKNKDEQDVYHFINHLDYAIKFMGVDNVCFGFDFMDYLSDYGNDNIMDVANATLVYRIVDAMRERGYSDEDINRITWSNFYNKYKDLLYIKGESDE